MNKEKEGGEIEEIEIETGAAEEVHIHSFTVLTVLHNGLFRFYDISISKYTLVCQQQSLRASAPTPLPPPTGHMSASDAKAE